MEEDRQLLVRIKRNVIYGRDIAPASVDADKCNGCGLCVRVCTGVVFELREKKNAYFPLPFGAAVIVTRAQSSDPVAAFNCAVALHSCSLMAHSLGLGSCFLGFVQIGANSDKRMRDWLGIPKENQCYGAMVVGYPDVKYRRLVERRNPEITWH